MLLHWTPSGGLIPVTLGDDASKFGVAIEQLGGASLAQIEALAGGNFQALFPRGNVVGELVFRSSKTYASYQATFTQFRTEYARLNQQGTFVLIEGTEILTFANAVLKDVRRIFSGENTGARMGLRYTFAITTIS